MQITRFEDIEAWRAARKLGQSLTVATRDRVKFPSERLRDPLDRCVDSMMANIAEGYDSGSDKEFNRFLKISYRSGSEFQSHLYFALDKNYLDQKTFDDLYAQAKEAKSLTGGFMRYLKKCR